MFFFHWGNHLKAFSLMKIIEKVRRWRWAALLEAHGVNCTRTIKVLLLADSMSREELRLMSRQSQSQLSLPLIARQSKNAFPVKSNTRTLFNLDMEPHSSFTLNYRTWLRLYAPKSVEQLWLLKKIITASLNCSHSITDFTSLTIILLKVLLLTYQRSANNAQ